RALPGRALGALRRARPGLFAAGTGARPRAPGRRGVSRHDRGAAAARRPPGTPLRRACHDGIRHRDAAPGGPVRGDPGDPMEELMDQPTTLKPTILVVEDEPAIADTIQYALESEGFQCHRLEVGAGVVEVLDRQPVALVVLDIGLPDLRGIEVCRQIRQRHDVPVIFLTARAGEVDRVVGLELGADDYVVKPFSPRDRAARVKAGLRRARGPSSPRPSGTAFTLDEERLQITYFGKPL